MLFDAGGIYRLKRAPLWPTTEVSQGFKPGRAFIYSVVFHVGVLAGSIFIPPFIPSYVPYMRVQPPPVRVTMIDLKDPNYRMYLPVLMSSEPPASAEPDEAQKPAPQPAARRANPTPGFSYPGPQLIVSDFPKPTNRIQTLLQPTLLDPPILPTPLSIPNIVQMPEPAPVPKLTARLFTSPVTRVEMPPPPQPIVEATLAAKRVELINNPALPVENVAPPVPAQPVPQPREPEPTPQTAAKAPESPSTNPGEPLLALSPTPAPPSNTVAIPRGEARGRFVISPDPSVTSSNEPGTSAGKDAGKESAAAAADKTAGGNAPGTVTGTGQAQGGRSNSTGISISTSNGNGSTNPFAGITILQSGAGTSPVTTNGNPEPPLQTSYGISIVSTEDSGGGLPRYGVFSTEQIFTVFVEMRRTSNDTAPAWTAQYGVAKSERNPDSAPRGDQKGVVLPFPAAKTLPLFPRDLVKKYPGRRMIFYALITAEGKMEQISIKDSPDPLFNQHLLDALAKWSFRPAKLNGESVAVKALFGVPLFSPF